MYELILSVNIFIIMYIMIMVLKYENLENIKNKRSIINNQGFKYLSNNKMILFLFLASSLSSVFRYNNPSINNITLIIDSLLIIYLFLNGKMTKKLMGKIPLNRSYINLYVANVCFILIDKITKDVIYIFINYKIINPIKSIDVIQAMQYIEKIEIIFILFFILTSLFLMIKMHNDNE